MEEKKVAERMFEKEQHSMPGWFRALSYSPGCFPFSSLPPYILHCLGCMHTHTHTHIHFHSFPLGLPLSFADMLAQALEPRVSTVVKGFLGQPSLYAALPMYFTDVSSLCHSPGNLSRNSLAGKHLYQKGFHYNQKERCHIS